MKLQRLRSEAHRAWRAIAALDRQVLFILVIVPVLVIVQQNFGSRSLFREHLAGPFPIEWKGILSWAWWFGMQGVLGFVIPVLSLILIFRQKPREIGLGLGDWKLATVLAVAYLPL
ncbi:MAG: CPBP family intramembrane glutamate endopeptidase, partial [Rhodothermales bacterium]|nr:CPBP family intramembrane glutamate endopeptidase [Rhodothermales bacterium]